MSRVAGIVLAAGAGRRMGQPKALLTRPDGRSFVEAACEALLDAGCDPVLAVLGAEAEAARERLEAGRGGRRRGRITAVINPDWAEGLATSLRSGLAHLSETSTASAAVIHLVDLPDVGPDVIERIVARGAVAATDLPAALARASYDGVPGHPVLLGRDHWDGVIASTAGDAGARRYLRAHRPRLVDVTDLASGRDLDTREDLARFEGG